MLDLDIGINPKQTLDNLYKRGRHVLVTIYATALLQRHLQHILIEPIRKQAQEAIDEIGRKTLAWLIKEFFTRHLLDRDTYQRLQTLRKKRNELVHERKPYDVVEQTPEMESLAREAISLLQKLAIVGSMRATRR